MEIENVEELVSFDNNQCYENEKERRREKK
jgi:hypothetical protein